MYQNFSIIGIEPDFAESKIIVQASLDVDAKSVNDSTVELFSRADGVDTNITYEVKGKFITIHIDNTIVLNTEYTLRISKIKNILGEVMVAGIRRKVIFTSEIKTIPTIIDPCNYEVVEDLDITLSIGDKGSITSIKDKYYFVQIASDVAFIDIELESTISEDKIQLEAIKAGQYFIRTRITDGKQSGLWSRTETFIMKAKPKIDPTNDCPCNPTSPTYIEYVSVKRSPENGETPALILLEFDGDIDTSSLNQIMVIRRDI